MKPILMAPRMAIALRNTKIDSWQAEPIDLAKPFKWQTRRPVKPQRHPHGDMLSVDKVVAEFNGDTEAIRCPYGKPGDTLWVRETTESDHDRCDTVVLSQYVADKEPVLYYSMCDDDGYNGSIAHWWYRKERCPSIHMPRWASRTHLKLEGIRIERLRDISESDAVAEGFESREEFFRYYAERNKKSPEANPWVWVLEFRRIA